MKLAELFVYHQTKSPLNLLDGGTQTSDQAFRLETCQRVLFVSAQPLILGKEWKGQSAQGQEAYQLLLRVACGLESQVKGETDVFGQIKEAWSQYLALKTPLGCELFPWMQRLFEDTKEVRAQYLQKLGAASYGSLLRKLLRSQTRVERAVAPVLLVGAGQIARSVVAWLEALDASGTGVNPSPEILVYNRSVENRTLLLQELTRARGARWVQEKIRVLDTQEEELAAWVLASQIVVAIPPSETQDLLRVEAYLKGDSTRTVVHLGGQTHELQDTAWAGLPSFFTLSHLFEMMQEQDQVRDAQFIRAERACDERARLRSISSQARSSVSLAHGWEDLALFA